MPTYHKVGAIRTDPFLNPTRKEVVMSDDQMNEDQMNEDQTSDDQTSDDPVTIYSLSTCSHCKSTKKLLNKCTIKYEFVDVDLLEGDERKAILADVKKFNPKCSFPTVIIGETVIVGFKEKAIKEALGL